MAAPEFDKEFLRQEYFHLQKTVEEFDQRAITIKNWSVTVSIGAIGTAFTQKMPVLLLLASGSALLFWIIEMAWKSFQTAHYERIDAIEAYMRGELKEGFCTPDISRSWRISWEKRPLWRIFWWGHVCLPHAVIFVLGIVVWFINHYRPFIVR